MTGGRFVIRVALAVSILVATLGAHTPHDIVTRVRLSPTFASDRTVFALITLSDQRLFALSRDGGRSFRHFATTFSRDTSANFAFSPRFVDDGHAFAASPVTGLFETIDGGATWRRLESAPVSALDVATSPAFDRDRTLLIGTANGCFRSRDAGSTWDRLPLTSGKAFTSQVEFAADGDGKVAVAGVRTNRPPKIAGGPRTMAGQLFRTSNGGDRWSPLGRAPAPIDRLTLSAQFGADGVLATCFGPRGRGVHVRDATGNLHLAADGLPDRQVNDVVIAPDGAIFAVTQAGGVFRAPTVGARWSRLERGFEPLTHQTDDHARSVDTSASFEADGIVVVGMFEGLFMSNDRGESFRQKNLYEPRVIRALTVAPSYAERPDVFVGSYGAGALISSDGGRSWDPRSRGVETLFTSIIAPTPNYRPDGPLFYAHRGLWRSEDLGRSWKDVGLAHNSGIPRAIGFSPTYASDGVILVNAGRGTFKSSDGGETWPPVEGLKRKQTMSVIAFSPDFSRDRTIFAGLKADGVWKSSDGGETWRSLHARFAGRPVRALALSPAFPDDPRIYVGTEQGLFLSLDEGATWSRLTMGLGEHTIVQAICLSPRFPDDETVLVATVQHGVRRSDDGGVTFEGASTGLSGDCPRAMAISPAFTDDGTVFLATHDWVWVTRDGAATWSRLPGRLRVDDDHPSIHYQGHWGPAPADGVCGQRVAASSDDGAWTELEFRGSSIEWFACRGPDGGTVRVSIDGENAVSIDLSADRPVESRALFTRKFDDVAWRVVRVELVDGDAIRSDGFGYGF